MNKETYQINIYKLENVKSLENMLEILKQKTIKLNKSVKSNGIKTIDEKTKILYYSYLNQNGSDDISWFKKWKEFFNIDEVLRTKSSTGHGIIVVNLLDKNAYYMIVFGRAYVMMKDYVVADYGIKMGEKLFDGYSIDSVVSKYVSLIKNKSVVSYTNEANYIFEEGEVADGVKAKIKEPLDGSTEIKNLLKLVRKSANMSYSNIKFILESEHISIGTLVNVTKVLNSIEENCDPQFLFPRMKPIGKEKEIELNNKLLNQIKEGNHSIFFSTPYFGKNLSNEYAFLESIVELKIKYKENQIIFNEINNDEMCDFICQITDLDDLEKVKCTVKNIDGYQETDTILKWLEAEIELDGKTYTLNSGKWYFFNEEYIRRIDEKIIEIEKEDGLIVEDTSFSVCKSQIDEFAKENKDDLLFLYTSNGETKIDDIYKEYKYNYYIHKTKKIKIFDRAFKNKVEICDLQDQDNSFIHTKIGKTSEIETCLRQSILGIKYFYDDKKDLLGFSNKIGETLEEPKAIKVLLLLENDKVFKPSSVKSIKFKLTFLDWYKNCRLMKYNPQVIVAEYRT